MAPNSPNPNANPNPNPKPYGSNVPGLGQQAPVFLMSFSCLSPDFFLSSSNTPHTWAIFLNWLAFQPQMQQCKSLLTPTPNLTSNMSLYLTLTRTLTWSPTPNPNLVPNL